MRKTAKSVQDPRRNRRMGRFPAGGGGDTLTIVDIEGAVLPIDLTTDVTGLLPAANMADNSRIRAVSFVIDGHGSVITTGLKKIGSCPYSGTILSVTMFSDQTGSIVIDIWKDTYANFPPAVADSITASAKPTISSARKSVDSTLTGWTTGITAGDGLAFNVDSCTSITWCVLTLAVRVS